MGELKSIILCRCILINLLFLITTLTVVAINDKSFRKKIIDDLPKQTDFDYYFAGLERAVDFCIRHRVYVGLDMEFGLFMVDVNLKKLVQEKRMSFPKNIRFHMEKLLVKTNAVVNFFQKMIHKHEDEEGMKQEINSTQLFFDKTAWSRSPDTFNQDLLKQTKVYSPEMLENMYGKWNNYVAFATDKTKYVPTPAGFGACMAQLAFNSVHNEKVLGVCQIPVNCQEALDKGSDYGYGLLHRVLLMVVARFSRDCVVFSRKKDKFKTDTYCMMSFNEAEYIALNSFEMPDLMFQQIALCGLLGHAQLLRNYWLKSLLQYQTQEGCFTQKLATGEFDENLLKEGTNDTWRLSNQNIMNGQCNGQFTAVAAAGLANALRYIIETYY